MAKKFFWKVWLRPNLLTKDVKNDYLAEVSTVNNTMHNEDVAKAIKEEGSDLQLETLIDVLNRGDRIRRKALLNGSSVQDGNIRFSPRVTGNWIGTDPQFNPKVNKITVDASPTADFRHAFEDVSVEVLGVKADGGARIGLVTDLFSGKTDGTVTPGGDLIITGEKIKLLPVDEEGLGIFFTPDDGSPDIPLDYPLAENDPKTVRCRVPAALYPGRSYMLKIVTRFTSSNTLLKEARTITYELPLNPQ
jgi:hypothetical protein